MRSIRGLGLLQQSLLAVHRRQLLQQRENLRGELSLSLVFAFVPSSCTAPFFTVSGWSTPP
jgi:cytochrome c biogenesis protein CcdA